MRRVLTVGLILTFCSLSGQSDQQWLLWNDLRGGDIQIKKLNLRVLSATSRANNDFFIIYSDGNHYNSRFECIPELLHLPCHRKIVQYRKTLMKIHRMR